jgi:hypothetical protein
MAFRWASRLITTLSIISLATANPLQGQESDRIWGRVTTVSGDLHEGFIRWDRNEAVWADVLDGSKDFSPFQFEDWWNLANPGNRERDRVIELAGYRITWDDDEPEFPDSHESGIRMGHIRRLSVVDTDRALLELRSGLTVELEGGATDLGRDLREILVTEATGGVVELEWEELQSVEFGPAPPQSRAPGRRLHGTLVHDGGTRFTGFVAWDMQKALSTDTLEGYDSEDVRRQILFSRIASVRPMRRGAEITLQGGETLQLFGRDDVDDSNDGILISDPLLGLVEVDWEEMDHINFHPPAEVQGASGLGGFDGGRRLRGTVITADSTEVSGWVRWDGDEEFTWELLDGYFAGVSYDIEFGKIASIERTLGITTAVEVGPTGVNVSTEDEEGSKVTLWDGRVFELTGSNDVDESNDGIYVLREGSGRSPEDPEAEWVMVKWEDFRSVRFEREGGQ